MKRIPLLVALAASLVFAAGIPAFAAQKTAEVYLASDTGSGIPLGKVTFTDTDNGLEIKTELRGLPPGEHGFHVHEKADCSPAMKDGKHVPALAAGGHYDPNKTGKHLGPEGGGHLGDLPLLKVGADGTAKETMYVKGVKAEDFANRSVMIHAGGDNYSDEPAPLGGGGARIGCGIISK